MGGIGGYYDTERESLCRDIRSQTQNVESEENVNHPEHLFSILKELLDYPAIGINLKDDGIINLFFDGCCECDIEIKNYTDLRYDNQTG